MLLVQRCTFFLSAKQFHEPLTNPLIEIIATSHDHHRFTCTSLCSMIVAALSFEHTATSYDHCRTLLLPPTTITASQMITASPTFTVGHVRSSGISRPSVILSYDTEIIIVFANWGFSPQRHIFVFTIKVFSPGCVIIFIK